LIDTTALDAEGLLTCRPPKFFREFYATSFVYPMLRSIDSTEVTVSKPSLLPKWLRDELLKQEMKKSAQPSVEDMHAVELARRQEMERLQRVGYGETSPPSSPEPEVITTHTDSGYVLPF
jgi:hypothetical protein